MAVTVTMRWPSTRHVRAPVHGSMFTLAVVTSDRLVVCFEHLSYGFCYAIWILYMILCGYTHCTCMYMYYYCMLCASHTACCSHLRSNYPNAKVEIFSCWEDSCVKRSKWVRYVRACTVEYRMYLCVCVCTCVIVMCCRCEDCVLSKASLFV